MRRIGALSARGGTGVSATIPSIERTPALPAPAGASRASIGAATRSAAAGCSGPMWRACRMSPAQRQRNSSGLAVGANGPTGTPPNTPSLEWGRNAAHMAALLRRLPVRLAIHASQFVKVPV